MTRDTVTALTYSILIILISVLIVSLSHSLHQKELLTPTAQENDLIFTTYFQTGNPLHMTDIKGITENEVEHMFAVRKLLLIASILAFTLGIFLVVLWEKVQEKMAIFLSPLLILWVSAPAFLFSNFDKLFLTFHRSLFPQGTYFFP